MKAHHLFFLIVLFPMVGQAQDSVLDHYVQQGLQQNLTVQQRQIDLAHSRQQVEEARGNYLPSLTLDARYTRAEGGRQIDFPIGDLLNPAYGAINDLLQAQGQDGTFPTLSNQSFALLRGQEQETKMRLVQPLYQPAIRQNVQIRTSLAEAEGASVGTSRRQLVADVKGAYFSYLRAVEGVAIFESTQDLVAEHERVNERLQKHGKVTSDAVYRARAEVSKVEQQLAQIRTQRDLAASQFNFLLNRPLDSPIESMPLNALLAEAESTLRLAANTVAPILPREDLTHQALQQREELSQLAYSSDAATASIGLARSAYRPNVSLVLDYGIQGTNYAFKSEADFMAASVVFRWDIFNGFKNRSKVEQARLQQKQLNVRRDELAQQIRLQVQDAFDNVEVARQSIQTAEDRLHSAQQSFRLMKRKYEEGMASQVDFIDVRTTLTNAEVNLALTQYDLLLHFANLERAAALYQLP